MSGFSADWLGLRESADHAARSAAVTATVATYLAQVAPGASRAHPVRIIDLATGTGSNPRYLATRLSRWQRWVALDADPALLAAWPVQMSAWATREGLACTHTSDEIVVTSDTLDVHLRPTRADIARLSLTAFGAAPSLVTASALLDLVSDEWLEQCAGACAEVHAAALFALSYDGRIEMSPAHIDDDFIRQLVNEHQGTDKGFGPALGPSATARAHAHFDAVGYTVRRARSDWTLGAEDGRLQAELLSGWAMAARERRPGDTARIGEWERARLADCEAGTLGVVVGHEDLAAWPATRIGTVI